MHLHRLTPLAKVPGIHWFSLQKGESAGQKSFWPVPLTDWTAELHDFTDTAALVAHLDLVLAVDTAVVHLAGAMGKPVLLLLREESGMFWLRGRADSPWYPRMRLLRQQHSGDWAPVLAAARDWVERAAAQGAAAVIPAG